MPIRRRGALLLCLVALLALGTATALPTVRARVVMARAGNDHRARLAEHAARTSSPREVPSLLRGSAAGVLDGSEQLRRAFDGVLASVPAGAGDALERLAALQDAWIQRLVAGAPLDGAVGRLHADVAPSVSAALAGVSAPRCDWRWEPEVWRDSPELPQVVVTTVALALSTDSRRASDGEAARSVLAIVALARDVERHPGTFAANAGSTTRVLGYEALTRLLARGLPEATLAGLAHGLEVTSPGRSLAQAVVEDRLRIDALLLGLVGKDPRFTMRWWADEWTVLDARWRELEAAAVLPAGPRSIQLTALARQSKASTSAYGAFPPFEKFERTFRMWEEGRTAHDLARILVAALRHEAKHGTLPSSVMELTPLIGAATVDPFRPDGGPLTLVLRDGWLCAYSWGQDGKDDGGDGRERRRSPDLVLEVRRR